MLSREETEELGGPEATEYRSYLLRLWREGPAAPWRGHVRSITAREERRFASLEALFAFLEEETGGEGPDDRV